MDFVTIIIIAVGLSMDAFAVSVASGAIYKQLKIKHAFRMASFFGGFQAVMPLAGYFAVIGVREYIADYDHWVAFGLLIAVGLKMIYESFKIREEERKFDPTSIAVLLVLAVATSIDALAIGVTLSVTENPIVAEVIIIGAITFALSCAGVLIGKKLGHLFESKIEAVGGVILIGIGVKILMEHLVF